MDIERQHKIAYAMAFSELARAVDNKIVIEVLEKLVDDPPRALLSDGLEAWRKIGGLLEVFRGLDTESHPDQE